MKTSLLAIIVCCFFVAGISAQGIREEESNSATLPITKISIFSSGLAYYEHSGTLSAPSAITLPFKANAVNDALMSLALNDPASANPSVSYQSPDALHNSLRSLKIDLSNNPDIASIFGRLRGEEIEITVPTAVKGKILGVEYRPGTINPLLGDQGSPKPWLSLLTDQGIRAFDFSGISSFTFMNRQIDSDLRRALELIASSRNSDLRNLIVRLPGNSSRRVSISYVIPAPVWKVSYRLDFSQNGTTPLLQGWAIVDNDGDTDWNNVQLSLVAGRPASFIQNLYPPYYLARPTLPLAIAGAAEGAAHDSGYVTLNFSGADSVTRAPAPMPSLPAPAMKMEREMAAEAMIDEDYRRTPVTGGTVETATTAVAGDQFEFTIKNPVTLDRQMSAMLPLVESTVEARKVLIFSGSNASGRNHNPRLGAELTNTSGMKLPAGPITVYDGGTYAGDALIEFWNEGEKRLISYGEDLSVVGTATDANSRSIVSVTISGGVMTINRKQEYTKTYTVKNNSPESKQLLIEHPKTANTVLESPEADEQTPTAYRFTITLTPGRELTVLVRETRPIMERVTLSQLRVDAFLSYASSQEIPPNAKAALQRAVDLRSAVNAAETAVADAERRRTGFVSEQDRIRRNLEAAGSQTPQGQEYLRRLMALDDSIDTLAPELERLRANVRNAQKAFEDYLGSLQL
ncbi:MAG: DUF4139 domain-containing protein [Treponema sp.]|jgi:hypothetical protein|nr:DUF4139 domain-containing protein [Treponema sp.]